MRPKMRRTRPSIRVKSESSPWVPNRQDVNDPVVFNHALEVYKQRDWIPTSKILAKAIGFVEAALFGYYMDQFLYWYEREPQHNGWFYRTHDDISNDINLPVNTVKRMKQTLIKLGLLRSQMMGVPAREWLTIDMERLNEIITPHVKAAMGSKALDPHERLGLDPHERLGLDPHERLGLDPHERLGLYNKTNINKTKTRDISGEQSPPVDIPNDSHEDEDEDGEKEKKTVQPVDRNEEYMPFAKRLADIIRKKKRINKNSSIRAWADDFRKLVTIDLIEDDHEAKIARVNRALDWYEQNIGGKYVPDIQSGAAFRQKFPNIESAIERQEQYASHGTSPSANRLSKGSSPSAPSKPVDEGLGPRPLFRQEFGNDLGDWLFENVFKPLRDVYSGPDGELLRGVTRSNLAQSIVHMLRQIQDRQKNLPPDFFDTHPYYGFMSILKAYVQYLEEARSWLDTPTLAMLDVSHPIFGRFRKQYARNSDHLARDPFTGLPSSSV